jgi:hypothetical protein
MDCDCAVDCVIGWLPNCVPIECPDALEWKLAFESVRVFIIPLFVDDPVALRLANVFALTPVSAFAPVSIEILDTDSRRSASPFARVLVRDDDEPLAELGGVSNGVRTPDILFIVFVTGTAVLFNTAALLDVAKLMRGKLDCELSGKLDCELSGKLHCELSEVCDKVEKGDAPPHERVAEKSPVSERVL